MRIGLFFGSFNPIHIGHLIIANYILNSNAVEKIWFVVSPENPLKTSSTLLNEHIRLDFMKELTKYDDRFEVNEIEFKLPKPSFTIDTLISLKKTYPNREFFVVLGSDSFLALHKWKSYETLITEYKFIIYQRPGFIMKEVFSLNVQLLSAPIIDISSTEIRRLIKQGKSVRYLVPDIILEKIKSNHYYKL